MSHVKCHMSHVKGYVSQVIFWGDKVMELVGGGSVIIGPTPFSFYMHPKNTANKGVILNHNFFTHKITTYLSSPMWLIKYSKKKPNDIVSFLFLPVKKKVLFIIICYCHHPWLFPHISNCIGLYGLTFHWTALHCTAI